MVRTMCSCYVHYAIAKVITRQYIVSPMPFHSLSHLRSPLGALLLLYSIICQLHTAMRGNTKFFVELPREWLATHAIRQLTGMRGNTRFRHNYEQYTVYRMYIIIRQRVGVICFQICSCAQNQRGKKLFQDLLKCCTKRSGTGSFFCGTMDPKLSPSQVEQLKHFIGLCKKNPNMIHLPQLSFLKEWLLRYS